MTIATHRDLYYLDLSEHKTMDIFTLKQCGTASSFAHWTTEKKSELVRSRCQGTKKLMDRVTEISVSPYFNYMSISVAVPGNHLDLAAICLVSKSKMQSTVQKCIGKTKN